MRLYGAKGEIDYLSSRIYRLEFSVVQCPGDSLAGFTRWMLIDGQQLLAQVTKRATLIAAMLSPINARKRPTG